MGERRPLDEKLAELKARQAKLQARINAVTAREAVRQKKDEDRRKVLLGTILLDALRGGDPAISNYVAAMLPTIVKSERDWALFREWVPQSADM